MCYGCWLQDRGAGRLRLQKHSAEACQIFSGRKQARMPGYPFHLPRVFIVDNAMYQPAPPLNIFGGCDPTFKRIIWLEERIMHAQRLKNMEPRIFVKVERGD